MKSKQLSCYSRRLTSLVLVILLASCGNSKSKTVNTVDPAAQEDNSEAVLATSDQEEAATISEIHKSPVWAKLLKTNQEKAAKKNMILSFGDTVRTQGEALAQIDMKSGLAFRIGGDSVLTIQPDNKLYLKEGEIITWVEPGKQVPAKIVTPNATAGIRGTTVFIKTPSDASQETEFLAWEGSVAVSLPNQPGEVLLQSGEEVKVKKSDQNIEQIRRRVRKIPRQEWLQRRQQSRLINNFSRPLPTLAKIDGTAPAQPKDTAPIPRSNPQPRVSPEESLIRRGGSRNESRNSEIPPVEAKTSPTPAQSRPATPEPKPRPITTVTPFKPEKPRPETTVELTPTPGKEEPSSEKETNSIPINSIYCWIETNNSENTQVEEQAGIEHLICPAKSTKVETKSQNETPPLSYIY